MMKTDVSWKNSSRWLPLEAKGANKTPCTVQKNICIFYITTCVFLLRFDVININVNVGKEENMEKTLNENGMLRCSLLETPLTNTRGQQHLKSLKNESRSACHWWEHPICVKNAPSGRTVTSDKINASAIWKRSCLRCNVKDIIIRLYLD